MTRRWRRCPYGPETSWRSLDRFGLHCGSIFTRVQWTSFPSDGYEKSGTVVRVLVGVLFH